MILYNRGASLTGNTLRIICTLLELYESIPELLVAFVTTPLSRLLLTSQATKLNEV